MKSKFLKRALCTTLACATVAGLGVGLTACQPSDNENVHIWIGVQQATGNNYDSMCHLLDALGEEYNFTYTAELMDRNADAALSSVQNALLSGAQGVIAMTDTDTSTNRRIVEMCEENGAYYAGYMNDFKSIFDPEETSVTDAQYILESDNFLGSVTDGDIARDGGTRGEWLFNQISQTDYRKIVFAHSPTYAYPVAATAINKFVELMEAWNQAHPEDQFEVYTEGTSANSTVYDGAYQLGFGGPGSTIPDSDIAEFVENGVEAIVAVNSLGNKLLPSIQSANANIVIYQIGREDEIVDEFPETIKSLCQTPAETIVYPLALILNAVNGTQYSDYPSDKESTLITGNYIYMATEEDLEASVGTTMNFTEGNPVSASLVSVEEFGELLNGSYADLTGLIASWTTENVLARNK